MDFFAGANTRHGFVSIFEDCFAHIQQLYILKGSSGCGKSTFMKKIAKTAEDKGYSVDKIYCSGDPESLDGIIIPKLKFAVADGTSPHIMDVKYPAVRENIINLGEFWDIDKLLPHKDKIIRLTDKKSNHYKNAYRSLAAVGEVEDIVKDGMNRNLNRNKLEEIAFKLTEGAILENKGEIKRIFASAFTYKGIKVLPAFGKVETLCKINGKASFELLKAIQLIASEYRAEAVVSFSALDANKTDAVYFPKSGIVFTNLSDPPCESFNQERCIPSSRMVGNTSNTVSKARLNVFEKLIKELKSEAVFELSEAKSTHGEIENIYIPAMDFEKMNNFTESFISNIFKA